MKMVIFGSTGSIGRYLVNLSLIQGHSVTAFTRSPDKMQRKHPDLTVVEGDVLDAQAVASAINGKDIVFCTLGAGRKGEVRARGTKNIVQAMEKHGVKRLICQSTLGVGETKSYLTFFWKYLMFGFLLREAYQDHVEQEEIVRRSQLDWTIVQPGSFTNGELTGQYKHGFHNKKESLQLKISRADVAEFMLRQLADRTYINRVAGLSY